MKFLFRVIQSLWGLDGLEEKVEVYTWHVRFVCMIAAWYLFNTQRRN
jgi:hypothetical protein